MLLLASSVAYAIHDSIVEAPERLSFPLFISTLKQGHIVFQAGGYWSHQGKAQHIDMDGLIGDEFTLNKRDGSNGLVGLGYYIDGHNSGRVQFSYGVNFFYLPKNSVSRTVFQEDLLAN